MAGKTFDDAVRVYLEKKGRGGKTVTLIKGRLLQLLNWMPYARS